MRRSARLDVASLSAAFVLRFYCPNGLRQVDLFANKFRRAERKRITLNPVTAGPGELYQNSQTLSHAARRTTGTAIAKMYGGPMGCRRHAQARMVPRMSQCLRSLVLGIWKAETAHAFAVRGSLYDFMPMMLQVCRGAI